MGVSKMLKMLRFSVNLRNSLNKELTYQRDLGLVEHYNQLTVNYNTIMLIEPRVSPIALQLYFFNGLTIN